MQLSLVLNSINHPAWNEGLAVWSESNRGFCDHNSKRNVQSGAPSAYLPFFSPNCLIGFIRAVTLARLKYSIWPRKTHTVIIILASMQWCIFIHVGNFASRIACKMFMRKLVRVWLRMGWRGGSVGRASDSRSKDPRFKPCQEHKKKLWELFRAKNVVLTRCRCAQPACVYARVRMITYVRSRSCSPCQSSVEYGNTKRPLLVLIGLGSAALAAAVALPRRGGPN